MKEYDTVSTRWKFEHDCHPKYVLTFSNTRFSETLQHMILKLSTVKMLSVMVFRFVGSVCLKREVEFSLF